MATTAPIMKRETLKSIGNVSDWMMKQRASKDNNKENNNKKKEGEINNKKNGDTIKATTRPRIVTAKHKNQSSPSPSPSPSPSLPSLLPLASPVPLVSSSPIEEVKSASEVSAVASKVRRIYSREFLVKFKYSATPFAPGVLTPLDLIEQYNKDFEIRERERQLALEASSLATPSSHPPSSTTKPLPFSSSFPSSSSDNSRRSVVEKSKKKREEGEGGKREKTFKLRIPNGGDDSILRSPMFSRPSTSKSITKAPASTSTPSISILDDKENASSAPPAKVSRSSSVSKRHPSPSPSSITAKKASTPVPSALAPTPTPTPTPISVPSPIAVLPPTVSPVPVSIPVIISPTPSLDTIPPSNEVEMVDAGVDAITKKLKTVMKEMDARRLAQRQKQIDYGKATPGYSDYTKIIAKSKRKREDPKTPNKHQVCSKRSWDGQIRKWRRMLHFYDPADLKLSEEDIDMGGEEDEGKEEDPLAIEVSAADVLAEEKALSE